MSSKRMSLFFGVQYRDPLFSKLNGKVCSYNELKKYIYILKFLFFNHQFDICNIFNVYRITEYLIFFKSKVIYQFDLYERLQNYFY